MTVTLAALLLWAFAIGAIDWCHRRVPNLLLLAALLPAIVMLVWQGNGPLSVAASSSLLGMAAGFCLTLPGYSVSKLGAGDVKLSAVMGFLLGWPLIVWTLLAAALALGAMSLATVTLLGFANARTVRIPAAVALALGFALVVLAQHEGWL